MKERVGRILDMTYTADQGNAVADVLYAAQKTVADVHPDPFFFWAVMFRAAGRTLHVYGSKEMLFAAIEEAIQLADDYVEPKERS